MCYIPERYRRDESDTSRNNHKPVSTMRRPQEDDFAVKYHCQGLNPGVCKCKIPNERNPEVISAGNHNA